MKSIFYHRVSFRHLVANDVVYDPNTLNLYRCLGILPGHRCPSFEVIDSLRFSSPHFQVGEVVHGISLENNYILHYVCSFSYFKKIRSLDSNLYPRTPLCRFLRDFTSFRACEE